MPLIIRRADLADLDRLVALWQELADLHAALDPVFALAPDAVAHYRENLARSLQGDTMRVMIAEEDGVVVGFIMGAVRELPPVYVEKRSGHISDALVTARCRRRGIGARLYRAMTDWFRERGASFVELSAAASNPGAVAFWRKMGFTDYMLRLRGELK